MQVSAGKQNTEPENFLPVAHQNLNLHCFVIRECMILIKNEYTLNARILGAGNRNSVSSSAKVLQAANAAAPFPS